MAFEADDDLPGLGQFYCTPCGRYVHLQICLLCMSISVYVFMYVCIYI
jgi:hypothetical protein